MKKFYTLRNVPPKDGLLKKVMSLVDSKNYTGLRELLEGLSEDQLNRLLSPNKNSNSLSLLQIAAINNDLELFNVVSDFYNQESHSNKSAKANKQTDVDTPILMAAKELSLEMMEALCTQDSIWLSVRTLRGSSRWDRGLTAKDILKLHLEKGKTNPDYFNEYNTSAEAIEKFLLKFDFLQYLSRIKKLSIDFARDEANDIHEAYSAMNKWYQAYSYGWPIKIALLELYQRFSSFEQLEKFLSNLIEKQDTVIREMSLKPDQIIHVNEAGEINEVELNSLAYGEKKEAGKIKSIIDACKHGKNNKANLEVLKNLFEYSLEYREGDDDNWYDDTNVENLLNSYLAGNDNVFIPSHNQLEHAVIIDNIVGIIDRIQSNSNTIGVMPIHVNGNHWVGMTIRLVGEQYEVVFADSFGRELNHYDSNHIVSAVLDILLPNNYNIVSSNIVQQENGDDCGPITVDNLQRITNYALTNPSNAITAEILGAEILNSNIDSESLREEHGCLLNPVLVSEVISDEAVNTAQEHSSFNSSVNEVADNSSLEHLVLTFLGDSNTSF